MTELEYVTKVRSILNEHSADAKAQLTKLPELLPEKTKAIEITIFMDQDGEGFLTVRIALVGPDLYVLNKAIDECALLFESKIVDGAMVPDLPMMDSFDEEFSVHNALSNCAATWLVEVCDTAIVSSFGIPVNIVTHDEYGTKTPIALSQ